MAYNKEYYLTHTERMKQLQRKYYIKNCEEKKAASAEYYRKNKEKIKIKIKEYRATHKEEIKERNKKYHDPEYRIQHYGYVRKNNGYFVYNATEEHFFKTQKEAINFLGINYYKLIELLDTDAQYNGWSAERGL